MKYSFKIFLIVIIFLNLSCEKEKYNIGKFDLSINIPSSLEKIDKQIAKQKLNDGIDSIRINGLNVSRNQELIFSFKKGDFTALQAKTSKLNDEINQNYHTYWKDFKIILYDLVKEKTLKEDGKKIDSTSRIEIINGIKFYVFEHNIYLKDINDKEAKYQSLRYSSPLDNYDLIIDTNYLIPDSSYQYRNDRKLIKKILKSITIE
ncbi:hypothetical protein Q4Q39_05710 [Flavivirga amylovorans]|uniref:Lipoprotein n=1 Tax=Flavivirga amylovorans TaxID=870486 RepID=A0ABT8WYZ1_9FLAO|nr:hypothetical protein [Flavivirga amylovorans]MDO5986899.1 hypothetical protein [Flavivirga amylovorans]